jgi:hypothetical protein
VSWTDSCESSFREGSPMPPVDAGSSQVCQMGLHSSCPHKTAAGAHLLGRRRGSFVLLCDCSCHSMCPIGSQSEVADEEWLLGCTCVGSNSAREIALGVKKEADLRKSQLEEVLRDIDVGKGKPAIQIQREILTAYEDKGYEAPGDFSRISRFVAAGTGRRGTRTARLLIELAESVRAAGRWAEESVIPDDHGQNQKELGRIRRSVAAFTALAASAAVGAYFTRGFIRFGFVVMSTLLAALGAWGGLWAWAIGLISQPRRSASDSA